MTYARPPGSAHADLVGARAFEQKVRCYLGPYVIDHTDSTTELDFWVPGAYVDVKEKNQQLRSRWHVLPGVDERDLFVMDELSLRKANKHWPHAYFILHDVPHERLFLASCVEMSVVERGRLQRIGKGKFVVDLNDFRPTTLEQMLPMIMADAVSVTWKKSECLGRKPVRQV